MNIFCKAFILFICCFFGAPKNLYSQVYPGDANDNGRVDHYDILYVGYAYGTVGPIRLNPSTIFAPQSILLPWNQSFADGINYALADANGNGLIEWGDLLAINQNYGNQLDTIEELEINIGISGIDQAMDIQTIGSSIQVSENYELTLPLILGDSPANALSINGLAFSVAYNSDLIREVAVSFEDGWAIADGQSFFMQHEHPGDPRQEDVALTRFGPQPISGSGVIGSLHIVIEDDLIGLLPADRDSMEVIVELKDILMLSGDFEAIPIVPDSIVLMVYRPGLINTINPPIAGHGHSIKLYPNPTTGNITIESPDLTIEGWEIYSSQGAKLAGEMQQEPQQAWQFNLQGWPAGLYELRLLTPKGIFTKKIILR